MISNIPDLKSQIEKECRFCNPPEIERIVFQTDNFYVMVSLGPIVEGYLLIVAKEHIGACLHLPEKYWAEFIALKEKVRKILISLYGHCIFYEHGKVGTSLTMGKDHRHCFHCHLHCIPTSVKMNDIISKELSGIVFPNLNDAYQFVIEKDIERYLLIEDNDIRLYLPDAKLRSQYLRFKLAEALDILKEWDWVKNQNWQRINIK
ncbi:MAG: hypothetical protein K2K97_10440 [Muribaculaceae bacterium]|nr:hypothetical protein [Muribaculaceae bacterium]